MKFKVSLNSFMKHSLYKDTMTDKQNISMSSSISAHSNSSLIFEFLFIQQMIREAFMMKCINMKQQIQEKLANQQFSISTLMIKQLKHSLSHSNKYDDINWSFYSQFENMLKFKLNIDNATIDNKNTQVWYCFNCLKEKAVVCLNSWMQNYKNTLLFTVEEFIEQTHKIFSDFEKIQNVLQKLDYMWQENHSLNEFLSKFDQTLLKAQAHVWESN